MISEVAQQIRIQKLQDQEQEEISEYNKILKEREDKLLIEKEKHLKELQEFKKAIDIGAIVSKTTPDGIITYVNDQFCKISGYEREELIGKNHNIIKSGHMDEHLYKRLWKIISSKKTYRGLLENRDKKGNIYFVENFITPILDTNDEIVEYISVSHDMTQLVQSLNDIKKVQKAKESFFTNISHEMKTPLNAVLGLSSLLKSKFKDDTKVFPIIQTMHESGANLLHLIETLLDLGKLQDNKLFLKEAPFNVKEELDKQAQIYKQKALKKQQNFSIYFEDNTPVNLFGDALRLTQLCNVLLDNAIKFTSEEGKVNIEVFYENKRLHFKVADNGIGIKKEDQEKIFNYEQIDSDFTRSHEGAGVGLTLASHLAKLMNAEITIRSIPKKGSCFELIVPLKENND